MWRGSNNPAPSGADGLTRANLVARGHVLGEVVVSAGERAWMLVAVNEGSVVGRLTCTVTLAGGGAQVIGVFQVSGRYGAWGTALTSAARQVRSVRLTTSSRGVLASAGLPV